MGKDLKTLQMIYSSALADSTYWYSKLNALDRITEQKKPLQFTQGKYLAASLEIKKSEEVFTKLAMLFGCADWQIETEEDGVYAVAKHCSLCSICKKTGSDSPCNLHCLNPMEGIISALNENYIYEIKTTMWNHQECRIKIG